MIGYDIFVNRLAYNLDIIVFVKHDVLWLHVTMHDFHLLQVGKAMNELRSKHPHHSYIKFLYKSSVINN